MKVLKLLGLFRQVKENFFAFTQALCFYPFMANSESLSATLQGDARPFPLSVRLGRLWFQWRGLSPLPLVLLMIVSKPDFKLGAFGIFFVVSGILLAELLRIWSVGFAGSATRTRGDSVPELVHAGPYRFVRNPLYLANIAMYTLAGVLFGFSKVSAIIFLYSTIQYILIVSFEEEILEKTFGESYRNYQAAVPRWLPGSDAYPPSQHLFSLKKALRSERSTFIAMLLMFVLYLLK